MAAGLFLLSLMIMTLTGNGEWPGAEGTRVRIEYSQRGFPLTLVTNVWSSAPAEAVAPAAIPPDVVEPLTERGGDPTIGIHVHYFNAAMTLAGAIAFATACAWVSARRLR